MLVSKRGAYILQIGDAGWRASSAKGTKAAAAEIVLHVVRDRICLTSS